MNKPKKGPGGDYYEYDLVGLASVFVPPLQKSFPRRSICIDLVEENGKFMAAIVIENYKHFYTLSYDMAGP